MGKPTTGAGSRTLMAGADGPACTWVTSCPEPGTVAIWRRTTAGVVVHEFVCRWHVPEALSWGYRQDEPPLPPSTEGWITGRRP